MVADTRSTGDVFVAAKIQFDLRNPDPAIAGLADMRTAVDDVEKWLRAASLELSAEDRNELAR